MGSQEGSQKILAVLEKRRDTLAKKLNSIEGVSLFIPNSTFYLFPDITELYKQMGTQSYEDFRSRVLRETGVSFCTREHFGTKLDSEDRKYIRFAYSGIPISEIEEGMNRLKNYLENFVTAQPA